MNSRRFFTTLAWIAVVLLGAFTVVIVYVAARLPREAP